MAEEGLKIVIGADVVQVTKSLDQLEKEFKDLGKALKNAIPGTAEFTRLSQEFNKQSAIINRVNQASQAAGTGLGKNLKEGANQATFALTNLGRVAQDAPFGLIGIANNIDPLVQSFISLKATTGSASAAFSALGASLLGPGGIIFAVSAVTSALSFYALSQRGANKETKEAKNELKDYNDELSKISGNLSKEFTEVGKLVSILQTGNLSRKEQLSAIKKLNEIAPQYFGNLKSEKDLVDKVSRAYFLYSNAIINVFRAKAKEAELQKISDQLLETEKSILEIERISKQTGSPKGQIRLTDEKGNVRDIVTLYQNRVILQNKFNSLVSEINGLTATELKIEKEKNVEKEKGLVLTSKIVGSGKIAEITAQDLEQLRLANGFLDQLLKTKDKLTKSGSLLTSELTSVRDQRGDKSTLQQLEVLAGEFTKLDEQAKLVSDTINNGINQGIDTFFNALANNQDPFKALVQSVQRLVVELGAAVVKALVLKAITTAINPGVAAGGGLLKGLTGGGAVRGDMLRLVTFGR